MSTHRNVVPLGFKYQAYKSQRAPCACITKMNLEKTCNPEPARLYSLRLASNDSLSTLALLVDSSLSRPTLKKYPLEMEMEIKRC